MLIISNECNVRAPPSFTQLSEHRLFPQYFLFYNISSYPLPTSVTSCCLLSLCFNYQCNWFVFIKNAYVRQYSKWYKGLCENSYLFLNKLLQSVTPNISRTQLAPRIAITILLTIFPKLYFTSSSLFCESSIQGLLLNWYFLILSPLLSSPLNSLPFSNHQSALCVWV